MSKLIGRLLLVLAFGWAGSVSAIPITDTVTVDGIVWAQPDDFTSLSWNAIFSVCGTGTCTGNLTSDSGTYTMDGWTWAGVDDVTALFNSYLGAAGILPMSVNDVRYVVPPTATSAFAAVFHETAFLRICPDCAFTTARWGIAADQITDEAGIVNAAIPSTVIQGYDDGPVVSWFQTSGYTYLDETNEGVGAWFYRAESSAVNTPPTLLLLGLGLLCLRMARQRTIQLDCSKPPIRPAYPAGE